MSNQTLDKEEWRPVVGYEGLYEVSNIGRVRSIDRNILYHDGTIHHWKGKVLKPLRTSKGYLQVMFRKDNKNHYIGIHRLVAMAFIDGYQKGLVVNHLDENPQNNRADNLEWCTQRDNLIYGTARSRHADKLSISIIQFSLSGTLIKEWKSQAEASRVLGINQSHIFRCLKGELLSAFGYRWMYKSDYEQGKRLSQYNAKTAKKRVIQLSLEGDIVRVWSGTRAVERELGYNHTSIARCARGDSKKDISYGYKWRYESL